MLLPNYCLIYRPVINSSITKCMQQFTLFRHKSGCFENIDWWESEHVYKGQSHLWHGTYTYVNAPELAFVACRVTSKLLGIGNCERQWDQTKYCCNGKCALISSDRLKKTMHFIWITLFTKCSPQQLGE